jgi:hypothetical protein
VAEALYVWTFEIRNLSRTQTYTVYPPAQTFVATIRLPGGAEQDVMLFPTYAAAQLVALTDFAGYDAHTLAPGQSVTMHLAAKGVAGDLYRVSWVMDASQRPDNAGEPTAIAPGSNIVSWINAVNTECVGEVIEPG